MLNAEQIMTTGVISISPRATLRDAIRLVIDRRVSGLPVVDDHGMLVGVISEFALLALVYDKGLQEEAVERHMTRDLITVDVKDSVNRLADLFLLHRVRRLPVVRDGRLEGVITRRDVLMALEQSAPVCTA